MKYTKMIVICSNTHAYLILLTFLVDVPTLAKIPCACVCIAYVKKLIGTDYIFLGFLGQLMGLMGCGKE